MKKIYLLFLSSLCISYTHAQITLTAANNTPSIGDTYTYHTIDGSTINSGGSGANVTWNYSTMVSQSNSAITYVAPSSLSQSASHPLANAGVNTGGSEGYYYIDGDEYSSEGTYIPGQVHDVYTDVREFHKFPITYTNSYNETFSGTSTNLQASQSYPRGGNITIEADAYGTLIMPYGTVNNVLRIKTTTNYTDTFMGNPIITYNDVHYFWFNANTKSHLLAYDEFTFSSQTTYLANYLDVSDVVTGLGDDFVQNSPLLMYPNPCTDNVNISLAQLYEKASVSIIDITGKTVKTQQFESGVKLQNIAVDDLENGIYFVQLIENGNISSTEKLIVQ